MKYTSTTNKVAASSALEELGLTPNGYVLVSIHKREIAELPEGLERVPDYLSAVQERMDMPVMVSTHPRARVRSEALQKNPRGITFHEPFG